MSDAGGVDALEMVAILLKRKVKLFYTTLPIPSTSPEWTRDYDGCELNKTISSYDDK